MSQKKRPPGHRDDPAPAGERASDDVPLVAIGASAGGLEAFRELLRALPTDTGMAFVLFQHLAPGHRSILHELLAEETDLPVQEAFDDLVIEPNRVYTVPAGCEPSFSGNRLRLTPEAHAAVPGRIDRFFRSLAEERGSQAIGVVLSGSGYDGAAGLQAIRAEGGLAFAQDPKSAAHGGMPQHAADRARVDGVLAPAAIAAELARLARQPYLHIGASQAAELDGGDLDTLFQLLRTRTGHDFSAYKHGTICRRMRRRMVVRRCERPAEYLTLLRREPAELDTLFRDILINVTEFFREPESFDALRAQVFPTLLEGRRPNAPLRIWIPGCSSGEEVYSVLITLLEFLGDKADLVPIQVFASDLDPDAIDRARRAIYSEQAVQRLGKRQLQRYFVRRPEGYEVVKPLRNLCVFAVHNLLRDPPFSHIDLVCCRNLLIYLQPSLQRRALQVIHYALEHDRYLLLGHSESTGRASDLFAAVDLRHKIYRKKSVATALHYDAEALGRVSALEQPLGREPACAGTAAGWNLEHAADAALLEHFAPPAVVVSETGQICQFRGRTGRYIHPAPGAASLSLLKLVVGELVIPLRTLLHQVVKCGEPARKERVPLHVDGGEEAVTLEVRPLPVPDGVAAYYLVVFQAVPVAPRALAAGPGGAAADMRVEELERELGEVREYLQSIIDDQEQVNEQLRVANEEVLSSNEELQSNNEEMETSREELQSTNEELATVNQELEARNRELGQLNADLQNLLSCVSIPVVMLTGDLRIRYFTPMAEDVLNLIAGDIGRPISDIRAKVTVPDLEKLVQRVMDSVTPVTREVEDANGRLYDVKVRPYKTEDNRIDGAVVAYIDITHLKDIATARSESAGLAETSDAMAVADLQGRIIAWNRAAERRYGYTEREAMGMSLFDMAEGEERERLRMVVATVGRDEPVAPLRIGHRTRDGAFIAVELALRPLRDGNGAPVAVVSAERALEDEEA